VKQFSARQRARASESRRQRPRGSYHKQEGYILLTLLLVVALMGIFALAAYTTIEFEIRRDQETEMIHRGVQYTRAIRAYYKKFQRYPTKLEDLDHTNNLRYLRKHYKDPLNKNKDFRLLHYGEQGVTMAGGIAGMIPGANPAGAATGLNGSGASTSAFGGGSGLGGSTLGGSTLGGSGPGNSGVNSSGVFAQPSGLGGNSNSGLGTSSDSQATPGQQAAPAPGSDATQGASGAAQGDASSGSQQLVAGGPIVGVASFCNKETIRIFNKKKKYNEWQFLYDPAADRGGLITTPYQPSLPSLGEQPLQNGTQPGTAGSSSGLSSFGQSSGQSSFGQSGFGNNSSSGSQPVQPAPAPPPQQQ
jgi:type II secretory pathway pseudopilin PulG